MRLTRVFTPTRFIVAVAAVIVALLATLLMVPGERAAADSTPGAQFVSTAGRILDTRDGTGGYKTAMPAGTWRTVQVTGKAGVPASMSVTAVALNLTEVSPSGLGQVTVRPNANTAATLVGTFDGGNLGTTSNQADVAVNSDGTIQVQANASTQLVIDVEGYYSTDTTATGGYVPIAGKRFVGEQPIAASGNYTLQVTGVNGIPSNATAVIADFIVKNQGTTQGYISPGPAASNPPVTSLNYPGVANVATAISAHVLLSSAGKLEVWNRAGSAIKVNIDIEGYFVPGSSTAGAFTAGAARAYDTRVKPHVSVPGGKTITVPLGGTHGVPRTADGLSSVVVDLTAIHASNDSAGFARAWADGTSEPNISDVEYAPDSIRSNTNTVPVGLDGAIEIHNISSTTVDFVVDIEGWYAGASSTMCANDVDTIIGAAAASGDTAGASLGAPIVNAVLTNSLSDDISVDIYLVDSSGAAVAGSPLVSDTVTSGSALIYHLPTDKLTAGKSYTWWIHASQNDLCASSATSSRHTFTMGTAPAATATVSQLSVSGSQLLTETATTGSADCQGSACPLTSGISVGGDATEQHIAAIAPDLSGLPAGAQITSAVLQLTPTCLASTCMSGALNIAEADSNVRAATTGADLAALGTQPPLTFDESSVDEGSYDITGLVQDWQDAGASPGAVITETNPASDSGERFNDSTAANAPAQLNITYAPPSVASPVTQLTALAGDGGTIVTWAKPIETGWHDTSGASDGITGYTVTTTTSTGSTVSVVKTTAPRATITGLTNSSAYTVAVVANNPVGASQPQTISVTPKAVTGGAARYTAAVQDLLGAQAQLETGTAQSTQDAAGSASNADATNSALAATSTIFQNVYAAENTAGQADTNDTTSLSNVLAVQTATDVVTLFATESESFTTVDTSTGTEADIDGSDVSDLAYVFPATTGAPTPTSTVDGDALTLQPSATTTDTVGIPAAAAVTNPPAPSNSSATANTALARGTFSINAGIATHHATVKSASSKKISLTAVANWADKQWNGQTNGFGDDCTDYLSRALHYGGGLSEVGWSTQAKTNYDDSKWFNDQWRNLHTGATLPAWSATWSFADRSATYHHNRGGYFVGSSIALPGDLIYANWNGSSYSGISHAGIVSMTKGSNVYIDQHTTARYREPLWKVSGNPTTWQGQNPKVHVWVLNPSEEH